MESQLYSIYIRSGHSVRPSIHRLVLLFNNPRNSRPSKAPKRLREWSEIRGSPSNCSWTALCRWSIGIPFAIRETYKGDKLVEAADKECEKILTGFLENWRRSFRFRRTGLKREPQVTDMDRSRSPERMVALDPRKGSCKAQSSRIATLKEEGERTSTHVPSPFWGAEAEVS